MTRTQSLANILLRSVFTVVMVAAGVIAPSYLGDWPTARAEDKNGSNVTIDNFSFSPSTLTVTKGTKVTWTNREDGPHTVVSTEKSFKSAVLDTDDQFSFMFTEAGTYNYYCSLHPKMTGKVVVK